MTGPDQMDGGVDETDRDQTEAALAVAIAALLATKAAGAPWLSLVQGSLSGIVTDYLRRSAYDMAVAAGMTSTEAAQAADEATASVLGDVERHSAEWLKISADDHAEKARQAADEPGPEPGAPPGPKAPPVQAPGQPMTPDDAKTAGDLIATSLATYSRERVREDIARKLGAEYKTWMCVVPDTVVHGLISALSSRPYAGELVSLSTGAARRLTSPREFDGDLTVTPNHMVLSQRGWVRADKVQVGDYLIRCHLNERTALSGPDVEESPPSIVEVFRAASEMRPAERMMRGPVDLDAQGAQGYVDVVSTDGELADRLKPPLTEPAQHFLFTQTDEALPCVLFALDCGDDIGLGLGPAPEFGGTLLPNRPLDLGICVSDAVVSGGGLASDGDSGVSQDAGNDLRGDTVPVGDMQLGEPGSVVGTHPNTDAVPVRLSLGNRKGAGLIGLLPTDSGINEELSRLSGAKEDASPGQSPPDSHSTHSEFFADLLGALPSLVALDEVVKIQRYEVSESHGMSVLDCSTETSWYLADGLVVHNSRGDAKVRPAHRALAGQTKRLDKPFSVDGSNIMRPGDPEAPPELVIRCRCHLRFSVKPV